MKKDNQGFILLEVIVSFSIVTILMWAFATILFQSRTITTNSLKDFQGLMLDRELVEITKDLEQSNWSQLTNSACVTGCHAEVSNNAWVLKSGSELVSNTYTRTITISPVLRNKSTFPNVIVPLGVVDPNTYKVTATVAWTDGTDNKTTSLDIYVHNFPVQHL